jgi:hypothetical protein
LGAFEGFVGWDGGGVEVAVMQRALGGDFWGALRGGLALYAVSNPPLETP